MAEPTDNFLEHYGVKGMHWGKHKSGGTSSGSGSGTVAVVSKPGGKAPIDKAKLSAARKDLYSGVKQHYKSNGQKVLGGAAIAASLFSGGTVGTVVVGSQMMRGAGFSKGKSVAMGLIGGAPGAALAIELKARKMARQ